MIDSNKLASYSEYTIFTYNLGYMTYTARCPYINTIIFSRGKNIFDSLAKTSQINNKNKFIKKERLYLILY